MKSHSLQNTHKHTVLPPFAKPGQFQNMPVSGTVFQKNRSLRLSIPCHSSAFQAAPISPCLAGRSRDSISCAALSLRQVSQRVSICFPQLLTPNCVARPSTPGLAVGQWGPFCTLHTTRPPTMAGHPNFNMLTWGFVHDFILGTVCTEGHVGLFSVGNTTSLQERQSYQLTIVMETILSHIIHLSPSPNHGLWGNMLHIGVLLLYTSFHHNQDNTSFSCLIISYYFCSFTLFSYSV